MEMYRPKMQPGNHICIPRSVREFEGMNPHTPKWTPTLGVKIFVESQIFKKKIRGQNSLG